VSRQTPGGSPGQRQLRVGEAVRHALAAVLERREIRDALLETASVTVSEVRISPDLRQATVFVMPLGGRGPAGSAAADVVAALGRARPYLRHRVGQLVRLKFVPDLHFRLDEVYDQAGHMAQLLADPRVRRDLADDDAHHDHSHHDEDRQDDGGAGGRGPAGGEERW